MKSYLAIALSLVLSGCGLTYDNTPMTITKSAPFEIDGKKYDSKLVLKIEEFKTTFSHDVAKDGRTETIYKLIDDGNDGTVDYAYFVDGPIEVTRSQMSEQMKELNDTSLKTFKNMMERKK